ncbi:MAG TPA: hypothetical protein VG755_02895 [Nannocystaceae bacterium]|nr:hypothetical protein [Nannocystaceae bacterium]
MASDPGTRVVSTSPGFAAMSTLLLAFVLAGSTTGPVATRLPLAETAVRDLAPEGLLHQEALRIDRDFGKPEFDLVVDTWTIESADDVLADVRLWWVKTTAQDRRSPLSERAQKYVDIDTKQTADDAWRMKLRGDKKEFTFDVELDDKGRARVFTDVITKDGGRVAHCRTTGGKLLARRLLGIPIGIEKLEVHCVDKRGDVVQGRAVMRRLRG